MVRLFVFCAAVLGFAGVALGAFAAHGLKARLALLGVVASIQPVVINQGEQWHRVRVGPLASMDELNRIRARLAENEIKVLLVRQKNDP